MSRRALVLSGGGAKGAFQIGVMEVLLLEEERDYEVLCGVSVGALNAAFLAEAPFDAEDAEASRQHLADRFRALRRLWLEEIEGNASIYRSRFGGPAGIVAGADSIHDPSPLVRLIEKHIDPERVAASGRTLGIQHVALEDGRLREAPPGAGDLRRHVLASATMPFLFPPVEFGGKHLVDGGLRDITPLGHAFAQKPDAIDVVYASPFEVAPAAFEDPGLGLRVNAFHFLARTIEILTAEVQANDVEGARETNALKAHWERLKTTAGLDEDDPDVAGIDAMLADRHVADLREFTPEEDHVGKALEFDPERMRRAYEHGRDVARRRLQA